MSLRVACAAAACGAVVAACATYEFHGTTLEPPSEAPDFVLTDHDGEPFRLSDHRGDVVLLYFGFTSCPDICPTTLASVRGAMEQIGGAADDVQVVMVTTDPERDTPERLGRYMTGFHPDFVGLTGDPDELQSVYDAYGITVEKRALPDSALGYTIDHAASLYVIDRDGMLRELFLHGTPMEHMASDLGFLAGAEA